MKNPTNRIFLKFLCEGDFLEVTCFWDFKNFQMSKQLISVRGSTTDYENFLRALRKRNGGWQGYLAEIMDVTQVRPLQTRWCTPNESYHMTHIKWLIWYMSHIIWVIVRWVLSQGPIKPLDVNLIKKVFWLIKFVADYFFVKGMATSGSQFFISGLVPNFRSIQSLLPVQS